jgi:hypothetical protein
VTVRVDGLIEMFGLTRMRQTVVVIVVVKSCASLVDGLDRGERRLSQQKAARLISAQRKEDRRGGGAEVQGRAPGSSFVTDKRPIRIETAYTL